MSDWMSRLQMDPEDLYLLETYRLEYKKGTGNYWKVLAVKRGAKGKDRKYISLSRLILDINDNREPDHENRDTLDNRKSNLRIATKSQNQCNKTRPQGISQYRGVIPIGNKWVSRIKKNGKKYHLGTFDSEIEAAIAYDVAAKELHGSFAQYNF